MKYYAKLIPFVSEMLVFFFVLCVTVIAMFVGFIYGSLLVQIVTTIIVIVLIICFIRLFSRVISLGIRALMDFILGKTKEDLYVFIQESPYQASVFAEKMIKGRQRCRNVYYLVELKKGHSVYNYTSGDSLKLQKGDVCRIVKASTSNIILSCEKVKIKIDIV